MEQMANAKRIAAQQRALGQALQQMAEEMESSGTGAEDNFLGDLSGIAKAMENVAEDFEVAQIRRKTIQRQQEILSRMLEAQHSLRKRDKEEKRKAKTAEQFLEKETPQALPEFWDQIDEDDLDKALSRALNERFSPDYQEIIREYFHQLKKGKANR